MECVLCGNNEKLVHHHISYNPEIIQIICRNCHRKTHWENGYQQTRPISFKSTLYHDTTYYQLFYKHKRGETTPSNLSKKIRLDHNKVRYSSKKHKKDSIEVTIPKKMFKYKMERLGLTMKEGIKQLEAVWRYGNFEGMYLTFEEKMNSE